MSKIRVQMNRLDESNLPNFKLHAILRVWNIGNLGGRGERGTIKHPSKAKCLIFSQNTVICHIFGHISGSNQQIFMQFYLF